MKNIKQSGEEEIEWHEDGSCFVKGRIVSEPSIDPPRKNFCIYSKDKTRRLGIVNPVTEEGRELLEKFDGKYVKLDSSSPTYRGNERVFHLRV